VIQLWSAISVAVLTVIVGPLLRGEISGRLAKRTAAHADLRKKLEGNADAVAHLDALLTREVLTLADRETHRLTRKLNGGNVAALIFVALVGGGVVYGIVSAAIALVENPALFWLFMIVAGLVGLFAIALAAVGLGTLYEPPREKRQKANDSQ
jgi:hypothetical protein